MNRKETSKAIRISQDVWGELDRLYPGISPNQAIRKLLGFPATERKARRRKSRIRKVVDIIFKF